MKKGEISNATLATLVVAALVVSIVGSLMIGYQIPSYTPTGFASTGTGKVNLSIESVTSFNITDALIDFGTGRVTAGTFARCDSNYTDVINGTFNGPGCTAATGDMISLWNDGTETIDIDVNASVAAVDFFCAGNSTACNEDSVAELKYAALESGGNCATQFQGAYTDLTTGATMFCDGLASAVTFEERVNMTAWVQVPTDAVTGVRNATITFTAAIS